MEISDIIELGDALVETKDIGPNPVPDNQFLQYEQP